MSNNDLFHRGSGNTQLISMKANRLLSIAFAVLMLAVTANAQNSRGYKGMVNAGWILFAEDVSFEALTIHGYQFNPHLFVGGGVGINFYSSPSGPNTSREGGFIPIFADVRGYLLKGKISPYADAKIGVLMPYLEGGTSVYFAPEVGCKLNTSSRFALNVAVEFILPQDKFVDDPQNHNFYVRAGGLCLKLGIEF